MRPVDSTYKILAYKALKISVDGEWISWAEEMLMAGFDSEHLVILAGERPVFNQFEMEILTNKVFEELNLEYSDITKAVNDYFSFLITECIDGKTTIDKVLKKVYHLTIGDDCEDEYWNFHLLYWAKQDVESSDHQYYWDGANKDNIDEVVMNYFMEWKAKNENANTSSTS